MPMNRAHYPPNWDAIATAVKEAAGWRCQECRRPCRPPGLKLEDVEGWLIQEHPDWLPKLYKTVWSDEFGECQIAKPGRFTLTTAHLNHDPRDCRPENLRALCAPCHCRYDNQPHNKARRELIRYELAGQMRLF
jgi:hypothetical protein